MSESLIPQLPDFDDPLAVLEACHQRMLAQCDILEKLPDHLAANGLDDEARNAVRRIVTYFSTSALQHHQDEEQDLFPLLNRQSLKLADLVHRLKQDHRRLDALWAQLLPLLKAPAGLSENPEFASHAAAFCNACREHVELENSELLSLARHIVSQSQLQEMGRAMARRRQAG